MRSQRLVVVLGGHGGSEDQPWKLHQVYHLFVRFAQHGTKGVSSTERPLKPKHVWAIRVRLKLAADHRDLALFNMALDSKLRGCDLVKMKVVDVMASGHIEERASVLQSNTQQPVRFEISEGTRASVEKWMEVELMVGSEYLWPSRFNERLHISTRQYARIVRDWVTSIGLKAS